MAPVLHTIQQRGAGPTATKPCSPWPTRAGQGARPARLRPRGRTRRCAELVAAVEEAFRGVDLLLCASSMDPACRVDDPDEVDRTRPRQARTPFNVTGHPAVSVMCGISRAEGLPLGLQLVAPAFAEATLLRAAAGYERAAPWREMSPPL